MPTERDVPSTPVLAASANAPGPANPSTGPVRQPQVRIRDTICAISEKQLVPGGRAVVDNYLKYLSRSLAYQYGSEFPVTCRRHAKDHERAAYGNGKLSVLYFHIGNAILGLYDGWKLPLTATWPAYIEKRIRLLELIRDLHLDKFTVDGDVSEGFALWNSVLGESVAQRQEREAKEREARKARRDAAVNRQLEKQEEKMRQEEEDALMRNQIEEGDVPAEGDPSTDNEGEQPAETIINVPADDVLGDPDFGLPDAAEDEGDVEELE
jgi:hypothetical protein